MCAFIQSGRRRLNGTCRLRRRRKYGTCRGYRVPHDTHRGSLRIRWKDAPRTVVVPKENDRDRAGRLSGFHAHGTPWLLPRLAEPRNSGATHQIPAQPLSNQDAQRPFPRTHLLLQPSKRPIRIAPYQSLRAAVHHAAQPLTRYSASLTRRVAILHQGTDFRIVQKITNVDIIYLS